MGGSGGVAPSKEPCVCGIVAIFWRCIGGRVGTSLVGFESGFECNGVALLVGFLWGLVGGGYGHYLILSGGIQVAGWYWLVRVVHVGLDNHMIQWRCVKREGQLLGEKYLTDSWEEKMAHGVGWWVCPT